MSFASAWPHGVTATAGRWLVRHRDGAGSLCASPEAHSNAIARSTPTSHFVSAYSTLAVALCFAALLAVYSAVAMVADSQGGRQHGVVVLTLRVRVIFIG